MARLKLESTLQMSPTSCCRYCPSIAQIWLPLRDCMHTCCLCSSHLSPLLYMQACSICTYTVHAHHTFHHGLRCPSWAVCVHTLPAAVRPYTRRKSGSIWSICRERKEVRLLVMLACACAYRVDFASTCSQGMLKPGMLQGPSFLQRKSSLLAFFLSINSVSTSKCKHDK